MNGRVKRIGKATFFAAVFVAFAVIATAGEAGLTQGVKKFAFAGDKFTVDAENVPVRDLMKLFSEASGVEIEVREGVESKASANFTELPFFEAVKKTLEYAGDCRWAMKTVQIHDRGLILAKITISKKAVNTEGAILDKATELIFMAVDGREIKRIALGSDRKLITGHAAEKQFLEHQNAPTDESFWKDSDGRPFDILAYNAMSAIVSKDKKFSVVMSAEALGIHDEDAINQSSDYFYKHYNFKLYSATGEYYWEIDEVNSDSGLDLGQCFILANGDTLWANAPAEAPHNVVIIGLSGEEILNINISPNRAMMSPNDSYACVDGTMPYQYGVPAIGVVEVINLTNYKTWEFTYDLHAKEGMPYVRCGDEVVEIEWLARKELIRFDVNGKELK